MIASEKMKKKIDEQSVDSKQENNWQWLTSDKLFLEWRVLLY